MAEGLRWMEARGPDGEGTHLDGQVCLGHRRLAILDLKLGLQPMVDRETGISITYNGEIYNYRELRRKMERAGMQFHTDCDTEVILVAYRVWGRDALSRLRGMFAFAIWDPRERAIWIARDRMGVKPLYFAGSSKGFAFASSVRALMEMGFGERALNAGALAHYFLTVRTSLGRRTLISGIETLEPGEEAFISSEGIQFRTYWKLPHGDGLSQEEPKESNLQALRNVLGAAVEEQLISHVPLGGFLSGGLDSTLLAREVHQRVGRRLSTFSVGYARSGYNEWGFVDEAVQYLKLSCEKVQLAEADFYTDFEHLVRWKGLPLSTPNEVAIYRLATAFRGRFTVALTGEGADELFAGYVGPSVGALDFQRWRAGALSDAAFFNQYGLLPRSLAELYLAINSWCKPDWQRRWLQDSVNRDGLTAVFHFYENLFQQFADQSPLSAFLQVIAKINLEGLLNRLDSSTMAASVEGRVPFTDHRLAELAFRMPDHWKMRPNPHHPAPAEEETLSHSRFLRSIQSKRVLRSAYSGRIPDSIRIRPKMSFPVPFIETYEQNGYQRLLETISGSVLAKDLLVSGFVDQLSLNPQALDGFTAWPVLSILLLENNLGIKKIARNP